jgi:phospholipase C
MQPLQRALVFIFLATTTPSLAASPPERRPELDRIGHIIVLFLENRSFDHLYGMFPGADGVENAGFAAIQVSAGGRQFSRLPAVIINRSVWPGSSLGPFGVDTRFATGLPNGPFRADQYVGLRERTIDLIHRFYQEQEQIDDGKMDKFVAVSGAGALPMGYFDGSSLRLY